MHLYLLTATLFPLFPSRAGAQTVQSVLWKTPDGNLPDLSQTFTSGVTLALSWNAWPAPDYIDPSKTLVDLWVTSFDGSLNRYSQKLKENLNLTSPENIAWTIAIPSGNLATSAKYVLRFKPPSSTFDLRIPELSNPGFLVLAATESTSASISSTSSPSISPASPTTVITSSTPLSTSSLTPDTPSSSSSLDAGAKAGSGAGVTIAGLVIAGVVWFFVLKRRRRVRPVFLSQSGPIEYVVQGPRKYPNAVDRKPVELPINGHVAELPDR